MDLGQAAVVPVHLTSGLQASMPGLQTVSGDRKVVLQPPVPSHSLDATHAPVGHVYLDPWHVPATHWALVTHLSPASHLPPSLLLHALASLDTSHTSHWLSGFDAPCL